MENITICNLLELLIQDKLLDCNHEIIDKSESDNHGKFVWTSGSMDPFQLIISDPSCQYKTLCQTNDCCYVSTSTEKIISFVLICLVSVVFIGLCCGAIKFRRAKVFQLLRLQLLILIGCLLMVNSLLAKLYICWLGLWIREIGFIICFGGILLVHYKSLVEWRTRKAHRWIVREKDLLRYHSIMLFLTICYLFSSGREPCLNNWFLITTRFSELILILFTLYELWLIRGSKSIEKIYLVGLLFEFAVGLGESIVKGFELIEWDCVWEGVRLGLSPGVGVSIVFGWKLHSALMETKTPRSGTTQRKIFINNDLMVNENINLDEMDIAEIRSELKRVYTQLELLRSKTMRLDNPHISKRRGGRKLTGTHRRFSIQRKSKQPTVHKKSFQQPEFTDYIEDSICSREGD